MELKINIIEAAAEIAEKRVLEQMLGQEVYITEENGDTIYTEKAQDLFNAEYDVLFDKLVDCKVTPVPNIYNCKTIFFEDAIEALANKVVEKHFNKVLKGHTKEAIAGAVWALGELNSIVFTPDAQKIFDKAKEYYEMQLTQFEI